MSAHAVRMRVVAPVTFECSFWMDDDGWKGSCEELSIVVSGTSFEDTKCAMSSVLKEYVEGMVRESRPEWTRTKPKILPSPQTKNIS